MLYFSVFFVVGVLAQQTFADEPEAIVGGMPADLGEFPWQISLQRNGQHICGGSIIGPTKILTAAHCVKDIFYSPYSNCRVVTGTINVNQGQSHTVKSIRIHPNYADTVRRAWENDIAVITLNAPIQYTKYQSPIAVAKKPPTPGMSCFLSGWGMIRANGPLPTNLLKMSQATISQQECQQKHSTMPISSSHLCAFNKRGIGACQGDSGGPFVCNGEQYGITSWSSPCAVGVPDVYTNVYNLRNFINES